MTELGHERFAVVGHDTGAVVSYALAADHRDRVERLAFAEIPGPPGVGSLDEPPAPPMFVPEQLNDKLWHIPFNRVDDDLILDMVSSNADAYYRYEYAIQGGGATLPDSAIDYYIKPLHPRQGRPAGQLRALPRLGRHPEPEPAVRQATKLTIPVLGIGGVNSWGDCVGHGMEPTATDVTTAVLPGGHWVAEQAPTELLALTEFLAPYRAASPKGRHDGASPRYPGGDHPSPAVGPRPSWSAPGTVGHLSAVRRRGRCRGRMGLATQVSRARHDAGARHAPEQPVAPGATGSRG